MALHCDTANNEKEALKLLQTNKYDLIITEIYLPDGSENLINYLLKNRQYIIIMANSKEEIYHEAIANLEIVDYVYKTDEKSIVNYLLHAIARLQANAQSRVAICDDSMTSRAILRQRIMSQNLGYIEFEDGQQAYEYIIKKNLHIDLLVTDVIMPNMDGLNLIRHIRHKYDANELPILALSGSNKISLIPQLLKLGANDYVNKPINSEEFLTRVNILLDHSRLFKENQELIKELRTIATTDFLTKLHNRNYFYTAIKNFQLSAKKTNQYYGIIMTDIDLFKKVNDTYGHEIGDVVLKEIAKMIKKCAKESDIVSRWGGEEFLVCVANTSMHELIYLAQMIKDMIQETPIAIENRSLFLYLTASFGVALSDETNFEHIEQIISQADQRLYKAKESGRNMVVFS